MLHAVPANQQTRTRPQIVSMLHGPTALQKRRDRAAHPTRRRSEHKRNTTVKKARLFCRDGHRRRALADVQTIETELENFFAKAPERKEKCMGTVYANERGLPMFRRGYERQQNVRECFRVPVQEEGQPWPSPRTKVCWRRVVDRFPSFIRCAARSGGPGTRARRGLFASHRFRYGEEDGGANGGSDDTLVGEHADVSLVVVEPVSRVQASRFRLRHEAVGLRRKCVCSRKGARRLRGQGPLPNIGAAGSQTPRRQGGSRAAVAPLRAASTGLLRGGCSAFTVFVCFVCRGDGDSTTGGG